ncbi:MAG: hypothetical protein AAGC46_19115 [Solirubrobacteraceae bacterium]|nr:hypothetical protein [Patulibacter sp.]
MRLRRSALAALPLLLLALLTGALAGCGKDHAVATQAVATSPEATDDDPYRLTVRSSQGGTEAIPNSLCGAPSSKLVVLPCGVSLGFARANAPRLNVWRTGDRIFLELQSPATAIFASLAQGEGDRGLTRRDAWVKLGNGGRRATIGYNSHTADLPKTVEPTYLSVLVVFDGDMPVPQPAPSGTPKDAVVRGATAEYLVQLAARTKAEINGN